MIQAEEAIRAARGLIGTAYSELDCINLIKKVIRTCAGGDKRYTTAGTNELWNSFDSAPKYRHLIWRKAGISDAKAGMLAFMGVGTGDASHTGLVTERGTVIHSSKSRGGVVETALSISIHSPHTRGDSISLQKSVQIYVSLHNKTMIHRFSGLYKPFFCGAEPDIRGAKPTGKP